MPSSEELNSNATVWLEGRLDLSPILMNTLNVYRIEPIDVTNPLIFLANNDVRKITGVVLPVDASVTIS